MYSDEEYAAALDRVWAEGETVLGCPMRGDVPVNKVGELLRYASERTYLYGDNLTADEAAWKSLYNKTKELLRAADPQLGTVVDRIEEESRSLEVVKRALEARQNANLTDWGFRVPLGFMIVGALLGFFRSSSFASVAVGGVVSWVAGLAFSIFVLDSADVQISLGNRIRGKPGLTGLGVWLFMRPLKRFVQDGYRPQPPPLPKQ